MRARCLAAVALIALGCSSEPRLAPGVVARIDGRELSYSAFNDYVRRTAGDSQELQNAALAALFEEFLKEELLFTLAKSRDLVSDGADRAVAGTLLLEAEGGRTVGDAEIVRYLEEHQSDFELDETVSVSQILLKDPEAAATAASRLENGESWASVSAAMESDYGAIAITQNALTRADLPERFADAVFALEPGEVTEVLEAEYGLLILRVESKRAAGPVPLELARDEIRRLLATQKADAALSELIEEARKRFRVDVAAASLPFERAES